jgi:hypothetical protein
MSNSTRHKEYLTRRHFTGFLSVALVLPFLSGERYPSHQQIEQNAMQITLERSGGFTGMPLTVTIDTAALSPDQTAQLHQLVEAADFFHVPTTNTASAKPDRFEYTVTVREGDRTHTITVSETAIPEPLKPLLQWLVSRTQQR